MSRTRLDSALRPARSPRCDALSSSRRSAANGVAFPPAAAAAAAAIHCDPLNVCASLHGAQHDTPVAETHSDCWGGADRGAFWCLRCHSKDDTRANMRQPGAQGMAPT